MGFISEPGAGPGVIREFLGLAFQRLLGGMHCNATAGASLDDDAASHASSEDLTPWQYDPQLRTHWLPDAPDNADTSISFRPEVYRACGALLGHAILTETF